MLQLCGGDQARAAAHRVLEVKTNNQLIYLSVAGRKADEITEDDLWFTMLWEDFSFWSLGDREKTSFRRVLPEIQKEGFVRSRYVKMDEHNQVLCDKRGCTVTYVSYKEAQQDHRVDGLIVIQYLYLYRAVNEALDKLVPAPPPPDGDNHKDKKAGDQGREGVTSGDADTPEVANARGGNLRDAATYQDDTITPLPKTTGGNDGLSAEGEGPCLNGQDPYPFGQPPPCSNGQDPPAQNDRNLRITTEESADQESGTMTVAPCAGAVVSSFVFEKDNEGTNDAPEEELWSEEAVLALAGQYLPTLPTNISRQQQAKNETEWQSAAETIANASYFRLVGSEYAIFELRDILDFATNPSSPSWWVKTFTGQLRLWHIANNYLKMAQDMHKAGWPEEEAPESDLPLFVVEAALRAPDHDVETTVTPELPKEEEAVPPREIEPRGMNEEDANTLRASIHSSHPLFCVSKRRVYGRMGYALDVQPSPQHTVSLYSPDGWKAQLDSWKSAMKPSERFAALRQQKAG